MRIVPVILLILLSCAVFYAQVPETVKNSEQKPYSVLDENGCVRPEAESQTYGFRKGKIVKILSANKMVFDQGGRRYTVKLPGIDSDENKDEVKKYLRENALNREVIITANLRGNSDREFTGVVYLSENEKNIDELSEHLLENGIAKYRDFKTGYLVPTYMPCRLKNAEKRAKEKKLGVWAK
jgi:hypothetical protein